jgi:hypothetical protein
MHSALDLELAWESVWVIPMAIDWEQLSVMAWVLQWV